MNMKASEYIERYVQEAAQPYAQVVVSYARKMIHLPLKPDASMPDEDDSNVTVFIQLDTDSMPTVLIPDHNCNKKGEVCENHPKEPAGHNDCYGKAMYCPYPGCFKAETYAASQNEDTPDAHNDSEEAKESPAPGSSEAEFLGAGS